jgi:putative spermidine/putrescine transport system permease protein
MSGRSSLGLLAVQIVFGSAVVFFLLAPIVVILPLAFNSSVFLNYPIETFSSRWFNELQTNASRFTLPDTCPNSRSEIYFCM